MGLQISEHAVDGCTVVELRGELDLGSAPDLLDRLPAIVTGQAPRLILDLAGLTFMDSTGLHILADTARRARQLGCTLALAAPQKIVTRLFRLTSLDSYFTIFPTVAGAAAEIQASQEGSSTQPPEPVSGQQPPAGPLHEASDTTPVVADPASGGGTPAPG